MASVGQLDCPPDVASSPVLEGHSNIPLLADKVGLSGEAKPHNEPLARNCKIIEHAQDNTQVLSEYPYMEHPHDVPAWVNATRHPKDAKNLGGIAHLVDEQVHEIVKSHIKLVGH